MEKFDLTGQAYMTSVIGDLPIDSDGMRKAVDYIDKLMAENAALKSEINTLKAEINSLNTIINKKRG